MTRKHYLLYAAFVVSLIATLGSVYFGDIKNLPLCSLCFYQRMCLFPFVYLCAVALIKNELEWSAPLLPFPIAGALVASYHVAIQEFENFGLPTFCTSWPSCTIKYPIGLGPISIPMLSFTAFFIIAALMVSIVVTNEKKKLFNG